MKDAAKDVKVLNIVKLYAALLLLNGPKTGYEIIKKTTEQLGKKTSPGQIYPFLKVLEKSGHLKSEEMAERDKIQYRLTPKGKLFVNSLLSRFGELIELAIEPKISVCAHCGCKVYEGGHKETINGKKYVFCCCHCAKSFKEI